MIKLIDLEGREREFENVQAACAALEEEGQATGEIAGLFLSDEERALEPVLWPSEMDAKSACRRELILKRLVGGGLPFDMRRVWERMAGLGLEAAFTEAPLDGWYYQFGLPDDVEKADLPVNEAAIVPLGKDRKAVRSELLGCNLRGRLDRVSADMRTVVDWKVTGFPGPGKDWGLSSSWVIQLQVYAHMLRVLFGLSPDQQELVVWRIYRDPYVWVERGPGQRKRKMADIQAAFRKFHVEVWDDAALKAKVGERAEQVQRALDRLVADPGEIAEVLAELPMDGEVQQMFGGRKCSEYCDVRDACWQFAGRPVF